MNGQILAKTVLKQRRNMMFATAMKKIWWVMGLGVNRRELGHQQSGQRT